MLEGADGLDEVIQHLPPLLPQRPHHAGQALHEAQTLLALTAVTDLAPDHPPRQRPPRSLVPPLDSLTPPKRPQRPAGAQKRRADAPCARAAAVEAAPQHALDVLPQTAFGLQPAPKAPPRPRPVAD